MKKLLPLVPLALLLGACGGMPNTPGPYRALSCGGGESRVNYGFNKETGDLYYFDLEYDQMRRVPFRQEKFGGAYLSNKFIETTSELDGNNLKIKEVEYYKDKPDKRSIYKITINLKSLKWKSDVQWRDGERNQYHERCKWIDPKDTSLS